MSLHERALQLKERGVLFAGLDAFGHDAEAEVLGECDDGGDDRGVLFFGADRAYEGFVDLENVDGEGAQVGQR